MNATMRFLTASILAAACAAVARPGHAQQPANDISRQAIAVVLESELRHSPPDARAAYSAARIGLNATGTAATVAGIPSRARDSVIDCRAHVCGFTAPYDVFISIDRYDPSGDSHLEIWLSVSERLADGGPTAYFKAVRYRLVRRGERGGWVVDERVVVARH